MLLFLCLTLSGLDLLDTLVYISGSVLIWLVLLELDLVQMRLLNGSILVVAHCNIVLSSAREEFGLHIDVLIGSHRVLHEGVSRGVFKDEVEWEATPINELLDLLNEFIDLGSSGRVILAAVLLQV